MSIKSGGQLPFASIKMMTDKQGRTNALALASLQMSKVARISLRNGKRAQYEIETECSDVLKEMFQELVSEEFTGLPSVTLGEKGSGNVTIS